MLRVLSPAPRPRFTHHGRRAADGQQMMQTASDPFLGYTRWGGHDYLVRQLADHKAGIEPTALKRGVLLDYARLCGEVLAKGHAAHDRRRDACRVRGRLRQARQGHRGVRGRLRRAVDTRLPAIRHISSQSRPITRPGVTDRICASPIYESRCFMPTMIAIGIGSVLLLAVGVWAWMRPRKGRSDTDSGHDQRSVDQRTSLAGAPVG